MNVANNELCTLRARALCGAGRMAFYMGDADGADAHLQAALQLARNCEDEASVARALNALGLTAILRGEFPKAQDLFGEALQLARRTGDPAIFIDTMVNYGHIIADLEERAEMTLLLREAVTLSREISDRRALAMLLSNLGQLLCFDDQVTAAVPLLNEGLAVTLEVGETWNVLRVHWCLGHAALWPVHTQNAAARRESTHRASEHFEAGLLIVLHLKGRWETPYFVEGLGLCAIAEDNAERGAKLLGIAEAMREGLQNAIVPAVLPQYERFIALAREQIGPEKYEAARAEGRRQGRTLPVDKALTLLAE